MDLGLNKKNLCSQESEVPSAENEIWKETKNRKHLIWTLKKPWNQNILNTSSTEVCGKT